MAVGAAPDLGGNTTVGAICTAMCEQKSPKNTINPNGAYPGTGTNGGNGKAGSPAGGWPLPACPTDPECCSCAE